MSEMNNYYLLGNSGLRISPLSLGTMTFGTEWGWGSPVETAREIFNKYLDVGGNFIDTADGYTNGTSEEMLGRFIQEQRNRNRIVLATKFTFNMEPGNPNAGGNSRKNIMRAIESSLRRLQTDYIDLYWLHAWDMLTPIEEVMFTLNSLVEQGKVRYIGLSDCPAWYVSRAQTIAEHNGWVRISAIQMEYNLTERNLELEYTAMVKELGMGICVWSPLGGGLLTGKHKRDQLGEGRLKTTQDTPNPVMAKFINNPKNWEIVDILVDVAKQIEKTPAAVALNFITKRPGVVSTIIGATKLPQLIENLSALDFDIPKELWKRLDEISQPFLPTPYMFFQPAMQSMISGGTNVSKMPPWY